MVDQNRSNVNQPAARAEEQNRPNSANVAQPAARAEEKKEDKKAEVRAADLGQEGADAEERDRAKSAKRDLPGKKRLADGEVGAESELPSDFPGPGPARSEPQDSNAKMSSLEGEPE